MYSRGSTLIAENISTAFYLVGTYVKWFRRSLKFIRFTAKNPNDSTCLYVNYCKPFPVFCQPFFIDFLIKNRVFLIIFG